LIAIPGHFQKKKTELTNGSHYAHLARYLAAGDSLSSDTPTKVVFLASSRERFITWILLKVDGGLDLVFGSSLRSRRLLQLFLTQMRLSVRED